MLTPSERREKIKAIIRVASGNFGVGPGSGTAAFELGVAAGRHARGVA